MTTLKSDEHSEKPVSSVLEQVKLERDIKLMRYDSLIEQPEEFDIFMLTTSDEELISFYNFLAKKEKSLSFMREEGQEDVLLTRIKSMLLRLEDIPVIQTHMTKKDLSPEEIKQIDETIRFIEERQRIKKMGPVQRLVYNIKQKKK